jgi:hypothetical protein
MIAKWNYQPPMPSLMAILAVLADVKDAGLDLHNPEHEDEIYAIMLRHAPKHEWDNAVLWEKNEEKQ